jgi:uncharacterized protein YjiS (DUF1127 family)
LKDRVHVSAALIASTWNPRQGMIMSSRSTPIAARADPDGDCGFSIAALVRRFMWALQIRHERRALLSLDDHMLKDIGLTRFEAWREGNRVLFDFTERQAAVSPPDRPSLSTQRTASAISKPSRHGALLCKPH